MSIKGINDLPILSNIWPTIFKNLSFKDIFNFSLVNESFKGIIEEKLRINKLIIGQPCIYDYGGNVCYWYYNYKLIEDQDIISLKCFRSIKELSIFNLEKYLKYLKIYDQQFKLEDLSNLINLESIEFGRGFKYNQQILNLNNLKVFVSDSSSIQLETPKLEKIKFNKISKIRLDYPGSIKHIITRIYDNKLMIFENLEIMELRNIDRPMDDLLSLFKNLKQLKINLFGKFYLNEWIKNNVIRILNDKIKSKRSIDIYLEGVKIENIDKFNELLSNKFPYWKFRLNNYDLLDLNLPFIKELDYSILEECVNNIKNDLPSSFFDKFFNINHVGVDSVDDIDIDIDSLNWFLNKLKYLNGLYIGISLGQVFYNNLPPNTIRYLYIDYREDINYEFILKLPKLIEFHTEVDKDLFDLAFTSFLNLKYLNTFEFNYKKKTIRIVKNGKHFYLNNNRRIELDYNQLIEECNKLKLELDQNE